MPHCINKNNYLTDKLKNLLKILPQILLAVVSSGEPFVTHQACVKMVQWKMSCDVDHKTNVESKQKVQILSISFIPKEKERQDGTDNSVLHIGGHHAFLGE